jgi:hypothetical protein
MKGDNIKYLKFLLSSILVMTACLSLHARSSCIYIAENARIYGREHLFVKPDNNSCKQTGKIKPANKPETTPEKDIARDERLSVSPVFPPVPSSPASSYLLDNLESTPIPQQPTGGDRLADKTDADNVRLIDKSSELSLYLPTQRQKLSSSAIQCGLLTSFGSNYPPCPLKGEKSIA